MSQTPMDSAALIEAAEKLTPLLRAKAREAELARRPLDEVIDAVRESGLFSLMVPRCYGGHEADLDTFFEVSLTLSRADTSMGWLVTFYIEHNYWFCGYPEAFQKELFSDCSYVLAPGSLDVSGGQATRVEGGYRLNGQWKWGTGIVHGTWVLAGALVREGDAPRQPVFFALPREDVEAIDTWHVAGMCGTGSWDIRIEDVFVPDSRMVPMVEMMSATGELARLHEGPLYRTPLIPILGFAAGLPILGAARMALDAYLEQTKEKMASSRLPVGGADRMQGKPSVVARAALAIDTAELLFRQVLAEVMEQRNEATMETRATWLMRMTHAVWTCREAVQDIASVTGASGSRLDNPIQRALRDVSTASNHIVFDRESRYADYGRLLLGQPIRDLMV